MAQKKRADRQPVSGEEKAREIREWLDAHPDVAAQVKEAIAAGERGEGVPFRVVVEEAKRRRTKPSS